MAIAFITARLGSKRLKKKNIKFFFGKPVIYYPIKACIKSKIFKQIIVSTESSLISNIAKKYKAQVPFLRQKTCKRQNNYITINEIFNKENEIKK